MTGVARREIGRSHGTCPAKKPPASQHKGLCRGAGEGIIEQHADDQAPRQQNLEYRPTRYIKRRQNRMDQAP